MTSIRESIDAEISANRALGGRLDASKRNGIVARATTRQDMGELSPESSPYDFDDTTRDILITHARQDAGHALLNTITLLQQIRFLGAAVIILLGLVLWRVW